MLVALDISELGLAHGSPGSKRGIHRVMENVLAGLRREPEIALVLTAAYAVHGARLLAADDPALAGLALRASRAQERAGGLAERMRQRVGRTLANRALSQRAVRFALTRAAGLLRPLEARFPPDLLADCDLFHSLHGGIPAALRARPRLPKLLTVYDLIPILHPPAGDPGPLRRDLASVRPEDGLLCISQSVKEDVCNYLRHDPARVFVAPLAAAPELFYSCQDPARIEAVRARCGVPAGTPYLLSLSTLEPRKNLRHLVRCFARLRREDAAARELRLVLVGSTERSNRARLEAAVREENLEGAVTLAGYVEDGDLAPLYSGALAFVFPSLAEGFGLPPLEAMQCGTPVICSDRTALPEVVGDAGLLVDPEDADALCGAMQRVLGDDALRADLARRGLARAARFSWERNAVDHLRAYRQMLQLGGG